MAADRPDVAWGRLGTAKPLPLTHQRQEGDHRPEGVVVPRHVGRGPAPGILPGSAAARVIQLERSHGRAARRIARGEQPRRAHANQRTIRITDFMCA